MKQLLCALLLALSGAIQGHAQSKEGVEHVQYTPRIERISGDTLYGVSIVEGSALSVSFASMPAPEHCGQLCLSRAMLVVTFSLNGRFGRYVYGRPIAEASTDLTVEGYSLDILQWSLDPIEAMAISGTATSTKPVATIVLDVTEYSDLACTSLSPTSNDIVITIDAIDTTGLTSEMVDSLVLTAELIQEYRILPYEGATLSCPSEIYVKSPTIADTTHPVRLTWQVADGTTPCPDLYPSFEVEVLRLYNTNPTYRDADTKTQSVVDWKQAQRFITYGPATFIDFTLAEGTGYYVWRVRPIGNYYPGGIANEKNWGCWSNAPAQGTAISIVSLPDMDSKQDTEFGGSKPLFFYRQFDRDKNWTFNRAFVEDTDGRTGIAEGITYASRLLQPLQVQTPVSTTGDVMVQQTVLDYEGRPLLTTLAAPKARTGTAPAMLQYVANLTTTSSTPPDFRARHFDSLVGSTSVMNGVLNDYWSNSNANTSVPSAGGYPYQRTVLSNDPLGRTIEQSAAGSVHKIGSGKTVRTSYGPASDRELVTMFGIDAPLDSAVSRMATTDQNGVTSVAYVRFDGKTIATCLIAGAGNGAMLPLTDSSAVNDVVIQDTVKQGLIVDSRRIIALRPLEILTSTQVSFRYFLDPDTVRNICAGFCSTCEYKAKVEVVNARTGALVYADSVDALHGSCPGVAPSTIAEVTHELQPGSYILRRILTPLMLGPDSTHVNVIKSDITTAFRLSSDSLLRRAFTTSGHPTDLDSVRMGRHINNEEVARRMLLRYRTFRDSVRDVNSSPFVEVDDCCGVVLDSARCKTGCETDPAGRYAFEALLFDRWETMVDSVTQADSGREIAAYVRWYDGRPLLSDVDMDPGPGVSANGAIDSLIRNMIEIGGYNCADLYACWQAVVGSYDALRWRRDSTGWTRAGENILQQFLDCAGTKYCQAAPYGEQITGASWVLNAWKIMPYSPSAPTNESCALALNYDSTWACTATDSVETNLKYLQLQRCLAGTDRQGIVASEATDMEDLASTDNPYYKPVDPNIDSGGVEQYFREMMDSCMSTCERRREAFRDSVVRLYNNEGHYVEGFLHRTPRSPVRPDTIRVYQFSCMVNMLVAECNDQCTFPIEWDSANGHRVVTRPNAEEIKAWQEASYASSFRMQRPSDVGDRCPSDMWKRIKRSVVLADLIVEVLNTELEAYRKSSGAVVSRWNARPIIARLAEEFPQISMSCLPPADSLNSVDSAGPWTFTVNTTKPSRLFVQRIGSECKIMYEPPAVDAIVEPYTPGNPHPLVGILNNYLALNWGRKVSDDILLNYEVDSTRKSNEYHGSTDFVTFYRVNADIRGDDVITSARADDPLKPVLACDPDGLFYDDYGSPPPPLMWWSMCDADTLTCIGGRTVSMAEMEQYLRFTSKSKWMVRLDPDDDSLYVVGDLGLALCHNAENMMFQMIMNEEDSVYRVAWTLPGGQAYAYGERRHTMNKLELKALLNGKNFKDSIGRFYQTPEGKLAFHLKVGDTVNIHTFPHCLDFSCTQPPPADSCRAVPICSICDTVQCGVVCFRWVYADTLVPTVTSVTKSCAADEVERLLSSMEQQLSQCLDFKLIEVDVTYDTTCFDPVRINDRFIAERGETFYHYTLYAYDRAGNLVETVPPSGFRPLTIAQGRADSTSHVMRTSYGYNSIGQLAEQFTPDAGLTRFWYDNVGRLRLSQNARQSVSGHYAYTNYDALGRVIEVGLQTSATVGNPATHALTQQTTSGGSYRVLTTYTGTYVPPVPYGDSVQTHTRNRITRVLSDHDGDTTTVADQVATYYSYDAHGNVRWLVQSLPAVAENTSALVTYVGYEYDLMSGRVRKVHYRPEQTDAYHQRYTYDHDGRIITSETSRDGIVWARDAGYSYEIHGPLRRMELGQDNVQGVDYTYTINGWLKAINNPSLEPGLDPGRDGKNGTSEEHALFGRDAFGMFLGYHTDDFKHAGSPADAATTTDNSNTWHLAPLSSLHNGNIGAWTWGSRTAAGGKENLASRYRYDVLNRIRVDTLSTRASNAWTATPNYRSSYTYDGNGNIKSLVRVDSAGTLMDSLLYRYQTNRNRLTHVDDPGGVASNHSFDVDDQATNNYTYDAMGNLTSDAQEGITNIEWTPSNKIRSITKGTNSKLEYTYDAMGNRVVKRYYQPISTLKHTTWYAREAQGNILSVYERASPTSEVKQTEAHIYGSSRIGIEQRSTTYSTSPFAWISAEQHRHAGSKRYELTDHLGNVRAVISDLLVDRPTGFGYATQDAEVIDRRDYYPFGMEMPGRRWRVTGEGAGRFGYNGKENDNEVKGEGNQQDYGFRIYDPRVARFLSVDPLAPDYPELTTYQFASNTPVWGIDLDGEEVRIYTESGSFIRGNLGHTFVSVGTSKDIVVYTYGRYDDVANDKGSLNPTNLSGEGVLIRLMGDRGAKFVDEHVNKFKGRAYEITDIDKSGEQRVKAFFEAKLNSSNELPDRKGGKYEGNIDARVIDTYNLFDNNCTTISCQSVETSGTKMFNDLDYITPLKPDNALPVKVSVKRSFFVPSGLEQYLNYRSKSHGSPVKDVTDDVKSGK